MKSFAKSPSATDFPEPRARANIEHLVVLVWSHPAVFLTVAILTAALVTGWAFLATPVYQVTVKLVPRQNDDLTGGGGMQSLLGQLSGPAELLGMNVGDQVNQQEAIGLLSSRALFQDFAARDKVMPDLFPHAWNSRTGQWRQDLKHVPTIDDGWTRFDTRIRTVDENKETGLVTLGVRWTNRQQAAFWGNELVRLANEELRERALEDADASLRSLQDQLDQSRSMELRDAISRLMEVQINKQVMAKARPDYAFEILDPAVVPDRDEFVSPKRGVALILALPLAIVFGTIAVLSLDVIADFAETVRRSRSARKKSGSAQSAAGRG